MEVLLVTIRQNNIEGVYKHLGLLVDVQRNFVEEIKLKIKKSNKGVSAINKLHLQREDLTFYESFLRTHLH